MKFDTFVSLFHILGSSTRLRILAHLTAPRSVLEIATAVGMTHSAVSHQLEIMRLHRIVANQKKGRHVFYSFASTREARLIAQFLKTV